MISLIEWVFQSLPKQLYINVKKSSSSVDMHIKTSYLKLKYKPDKLEWAMKYKDYIEEQ